MERLLIEISRCGQKELRVHLFLKKFLKNLILTEWLLDTLEALFDFYFVAPAHLEARQNALDQKLQEAGKPPMKK